jgi:hypothetical protein
VERRHRCRPHRASRARSHVPARGTRRRRLPAPWPLQREQQLMCCCGTSCGKTVVTASCTCFRPGMEPIETGRALCSRTFLVGRVVLLRAPRRLPLRLGLLRLPRRLGRCLRGDLGGLGRRLCRDRRRGLDRLGLLGRLRPARRATAPSRRGSGRAGSFGSSLQALLLLPLPVLAPAANRS